MKLSKMTFRLQLALSTFLVAAPMAALLTTLARPTVLMMGGMVGMSVDTTLFVMFAVLFALVWLLAFAVVRRYAH